MRRRRVGGTTEPRYQFKFSLPVANLAVNTKIKGEDRKLEIWTRGETDLHILEASSVVAKEDFVRELLISTGRGKGRERRITVDSRSSPLNTLSSTASSQEQPTSAG